MNEVNTTHGDEIREISHILKYAGRFKLLTKEQEYDLLTIFQASALLMKSVLSLPIKKSSRKQLKDLSQVMANLRYAKYKATERLVSCNLRLILRYAFTYMDRGICLTDLLNEGVDGLIHAAELFDMNTGNKFSTYCTHWIRQRQGRAIENKSRLVKIPPTMLTKITKLSKIYRRWIEKYGEPPTPEEISSQFMTVYQEAVTAEECKELGRLKDSHSSLDATIGEDENISLVTYLACDESYQPEQLVEKSSDKDYVASHLLDRLPDEDAAFIRLKYGFVDEKERTDKEMSVLYQISVKDIKAKDKEILEKLRKMSSRQSLNRNCLCDVILDSCGPNRFEVVTKLRSLNLNLTLVACGKIVDELPARVVYKTTQDRADEIADEFLNIGAKALVVNHV